MELNDFVWYFDESNLFGGPKQSFDSVNT